MPWSRKVSILPITGRGPKSRHSTSRWSEPWPLMPAQVDADIEVRAKTVGELRKLTAWPENLAVTTPQDGYPDSAVRVSKVSAGDTHVAEVVAPTVIS